VKLHRNCFRGCLLGGAVGDALGAPVEFMARDEILRHFGPAGIAAYAPGYGGAGTITDDTQLTLFTAEGLLRAWVRGCFNGHSSIPAITRLAYLRWLRTQQETPGTEDAEAAGLDGWLIQQSELHQRRAPGYTCLTALRDPPPPDGEPVNESKGCGGVMRVAPVGLFLWLAGGPRAPHHAFRLAADLAALTHGHPTGQLTAGVLAALVLLLADGEDLARALAATRGILAQHPGHEETLHAMLQAEALAGSPLAPAAAIARLGQGWLAEEALAIAIYCALVARSFRDGVILAVNHDGDSDSTGSIVGNLLGAMHGVEAIPAEWLEPLELRHVITQVADDLYDYRDWDIGEHSANQALNEQVWARYPG
jgi:ADP-ribosylglycohydrolase